MLLTPHSLVGMAIATVVPNPAVAVPLSFISHFLGDLVPHWDFFTHTTEEERKDGWRPIAVMAELSIGVSLGTAITLYALWVVKDPNLALRIFMCGVAAVLPDVISTPALYKSGNNIISQKVGELQGKLQFQAGPIFGTLTQLIVSSCALLVILHSVKLL